MLRGALGITAIVVCAAACGTELEDPYITLLQKHVGMGEPPPDTSNAYAFDPAAAALGKRFYFDTNFSGAEVYADTLLRPMTTPGRTTTGAPIRVSCNTCHDVARGGSDHTTAPDSLGLGVSFGGGAYDVNGEQSINSAYATIIYWNGRNDSLWSQIEAVTESHVSLNSSRLRTAWRIADAYRADYAAVFPDYPLPPQLDSITAQQARVQADGTCPLVAGACPTEFCEDDYGVCLPRFPLAGRPGFVHPGELPTCEHGSTDTLLQPYGDAYDCMALADQLAATRVYVNYAKAVAAYEFTLVSKDAPFDTWAEGGFQPGTLGAAAERGARLFVGKANCAECHSGPMFSDYKFHNIGIPQVGTYIPKQSDCAAGGFCDCVTDDRFAPTNCIPIGARDGLRKLQASKLRRDSIWSDDEDCRRHFTVHTDVNYAAAHPDECDGRVGYYSQPLTDALVGQWRTPSLRDVALTAPYMHTGVYKTLRDVVQHYNTGAVTTLGGELNGTLDDKIKVLNLTDQEVDDLVAFLESLTGQVDPAVTAAPVVPADSPF